MSSESSVPEMGKALLKIIVSMDQLCKQEKYRNRTESTENYETVVVSNRN